MRSANTCWARNAGRCAMKNSLWAKRIRGAGKAVGRQVAMMLVAIVIVMIFLAVSGYDPAAVLQGLGRAFTRDLAGTIRWATPLILAGVAVCIPFKAEVFNLGVDGQIYLGAIASTWIALALPETTGRLGLLPVFLAGAAAGALFALIPALMKVYFGTDMVVTTLLLNFVGQLLTEFMAAEVMRDPEKITQMNASRTLPEALWMPKLGAFGASSASVGIYLAVIVALIAAFLFFKTTLGYEIKLVGTNQQFARYGGMKPNGIILKVMALSGAVAGVIGAMEVTAVQHKLIAAFNPDIGFDGIVVALLANNNPLGVILSGFFFGALKNGGSIMQRVTSVPQIVTEIIMAIIILTISADVGFKFIRRRKERKTHGNAV
ncbi:ABC transporter permease [Anaerotruncus massiliensis (ex Liu et al. 2021)]|uniref:ABC transporter permease n=2 Tax=Anaerotruncus TaxID=244127 RepID=A0A498CP96_9FIRM|nr:ABC transporter permease [Anaerotruncus massiliensis (ex Liu et al. 2021)]